MIVIALAVVSLGIVAWGQPHFSAFLSIAASSVGFALFWFSLLHLQKKRQRFILGTLWFAAVQLVQLYWLASPTYQGAYIYFVYVILSFFLGLQFGLLSLCFPQSGPIPGLRMLAIGGLWTLMEWGRLFILCGFAWNPIGLSLTGSVWGMQLAAVVGIFGLSFAVMVTNLLAVNLFIRKQMPHFLLYFGAVLVPYVFGALHVGYHKKRQKKEELYRVALVQTALFPDQKQPYIGKERHYVDPIVQWERIMHYLKRCHLRTFDLIVLPESAVPFHSHTPIYLLKAIERTFGKNFGQLETLLKEPLAENRQGEWFLSNALLTQALANHYKAEVVIGLDAKEAGHYYNAAFHFSSEKNTIFRYDKQILLPLAESLPSFLSFLKPLVARYGILEFFTPGKEAKVINGKYPLSLSICYEECFPHLLREGRRKGAKVFVNVTNDAWYPRSSLPAQHFTHARVRAVENGAPLLRACNTGITAGIDSLGRTIASLKGSQGEFEMERGALDLICRPYSFSTLYTFWGDWLILGLSLVSLIFLKSRISLPKNGPSLRL